MSTNIEMLIGICGGKLSIYMCLLLWHTYTYLGICAGKNSVANYLTQNLGFVRLHLTQEPSPPLEDEQHDAGEEYFACVQSLLLFVTRHWQQRWVTTDVWSESILENLLKRPSFILVSIDAPVGLRWKRLKDRWVGQTSVSQDQELTIQMWATKRGLANPGGIRTSQWWPFVQFQRWSSLPHRSRRNSSGKSDTVHRTFAWDSAWSRSS